MNTAKTMFVAALVACTSGSVLAIGPGDLIFTRRDTGGPDQINLFSGGVVTNLVTFDDPITRLSDLVMAPDGTVFVGNGPLPPPDPNVSSASIIRVQDILGTPVITNLASGIPLWNPVGVTFDVGNNQVLTVNNLGSDFDVTDRAEGVLGVELDGTVTKVFEQNPLPPRPRFEAGGYIEPDPQGTGDFITVSVNGGIFDGGGGGVGELQGSQLYRLEVPGAGAVGTGSLLVDLSDTTVTGLAEPLTFVVGITSVPGTNELFVTNKADLDSVFRVTLTGDGQFESITKIIDGLNDPEEITYDPFNDKLVIAEVDKISRINLDGSGYEVLVETSRVRGIVVIPSPAGLSTLALGGLLILRRRR